MRTIILSLVFQFFISGATHAQAVKDYTVLLNQVFAFFEKNASSPAGKNETRIRNETTSKWVEIKVKEKFDLPYPARLRYRKSHCFKVKELVFSVAKLKDPGLTRLWNSGLEKSPHVDSILFIRDRINDVPYADSLHFKVTDYYNDETFKKKYHNEAYSKELKVVEETFIFRLMKNSLDGWLAVQCSVQVIGKDHYELQLIFTRFEDDCTGI